MTTPTPGKLGMICARRGVRGCTDITAARESKAVMSVSRNAVLGMNATAASGAIGVCAYPAGVGIDRRCFGRRPRSLRCIDHPAIEASS